MRRLYLLRHAKSSWDDPALDDFERPLADKGRKAAGAMARYMAAAAVHPALVLCSAARRTRETFAIIEPRLRGVPVAYEDSVYEAAKHDLLVRLRRLDDHLPSVLLIGHNPGMERLAHALAAGHGDPEAVARMEEKFPTGALAILDCAIDHWGQLDDGLCRLVGFVRPKDLKD